MFLDNKYHRWYDAIVAQGDDSASYVEKHHILPKKLGGSNKRGNLVRVAARKHFLLHWLLTKFTTGQAYYKMLHALDLMSAFKKGERRLSSWQYAVSRLAKSKVMKALNANPDFKTIQAKASRANLNKLKSDPDFIEKHRVACSEGMIRQRQDPVFNAKATAAASENVTKLNADADFRAKATAGTKAMFADPVRAAARAAKVSATWAAKRKAKIHKDL
jgi:hypothetical protein